MTSPYRLGHEAEVELAEMARGDGCRLALVQPGSKGKVDGAFDVTVIEPPTRATLHHRHTVWLVNVKRNAWAGPAERTALYALAARFHAVGVLARKDVEPNHKGVWRFCGIRPNGEHQPVEMTDEWAGPPWEISPT